jgi:hypothetical protein
MAALLTKLLASSPLRKLLTLAPLLVLAPAGVSHADDHVVLGYAAIMHGTQGGAGRGIAADSWGNTYTTGTFSGTVDFDPGSGTAYFTSTGNADVFIQKLDRSGNLEWVSVLAGAAIKSAEAIAVGSLGCITITGWYEGTVDFDPGVGEFELTAANRSSFVQKLDADGNLLWVRSISATRSAYGFGIDIDDEDNVYVTGSFWGLADFDPRANAATIRISDYYDLFVLKLDSMGHLVWVKSVGGTEWESGSDIVVDDSGNVYVTGGFQQSVDFDPSPAAARLHSIGENDIFVLKLDTDGDFIWARAMGGLDSDHGNGIAVDESHNVYTTGTFWGTSDFDPGPGAHNLTSQNVSAAFVSKLDPEGRHVWAHSVGNTGRAITLDANGAVYAIGHARGWFDWDPGQGTSVSYAVSGIFLWNLSSHGDFVWAESKRHLGAGAIAVNKLGDVYSTGGFFGGVDFDPNADLNRISSTGDTDAYVWKLVQLDRFDIDHSGSVNTIDLQYVVNAILQLPVPDNFTTDVNGDERTEITDLFEVLDIILSQ